MRVALYIISTCVQVQYESYYYVATIDNTIQLYVNENF